jgi:hypothetical protein
MLRLCPAGRKQVTKNAAKTGVRATMLVSTSHNLPQNIVTVSRFGSFAMLAKGRPARILLHGGKIADDTPGDGLAAS